MSLFKKKTKTVMNHFYLVDICDINDSNSVLHEDAVLVTETITEPNREPYAHNRLIYHGEVGQGFVCKVVGQVC
jgi:hypothetical protein